MFISYIMTIAFVERKTILSSMMQFDRYKLMNINSGNLNVSILRYAIFHLITIWQHHNFNWWWNTADTFIKLVCNHHLFGYKEIGCRSRTYIIARLTILKSCQILTLHIVALMDLNITATILCCWIKKQMIEKIYSTGQL